MPRKLRKEEVAAIKAGRNFQFGVKGFSRHDKPKPEIVSGRGMSSLGESFTVKEQKRIKQEALFNAQLSGKREAITGKKL